MEPVFQMTVLAKTILNRIQRSCQVRETIVNDEFSEIIHMLISAFDQYGDASVDFYPKELRDEIDAINEQVYANVNNGEWYRQVKGQSAKLMA
jgi:glutathionyl-hydroquinone reductase